ncbi:MAG: FAD-binding protein, partial [Schleiferiaceae bacterium]|nr:FAD-binding protein [Schleiferiaceae bacterium]
MALTATNNTQISNILKELQPKLSGQVYTDDLMRALYATDASVYREYPAGVAYPKDEADIVAIVAFCNQHRIPIIPRAAGTSLAGQCVGTGLVVDVSRYMTRVLDWNPETGVVWVQPGVVRDELNALVVQDGWFFGPNTSTANRCMLGGMVGNNSSGSTSVKYGVTRDKVLAIRAVLANGDVHEFAAHNQNYEPHPVEKALLEWAADPSLCEEMQTQLPKSSIHRRNTGYALEALVPNWDAKGKESTINIAKLLCGSEGTLSISTAIQLQLDPLPPAHMVLLAAHFYSISDCMKATVQAMQHAPYACELMDKTILDCTKENIEQRENRFFVAGDPAAILILEMRADTAAQLEIEVAALEATLNNHTAAYSTVHIAAEDAAKVWNLRAAGLGLLANLPGTQKALACIEDTAVALEDLPAYIEEFEALMRQFGQKAVYYAHAGAGEIHLRPILDLRTEAGLRHFREISAASAALVKKYRGSLSGEHGDGRVRAEFLPDMVGARLYRVFCDIKQLFDPNGILNPGKIVAAAPMDTQLREDPDHPLVPMTTFMHFGGATGYHAAAEKCNGSGDCRKLAGNGTMCPSYQATREEKHTTRARANALREYIRNADTREKAMANPDLKEVMELCISCKGCKRECPSNVDMSTLKAEWQYQYYQTHNRPLRDIVFAQLDRISPIASFFAPLANAPQRVPLLRRWLQQSLGISEKRQLPEFAGKTWLDYYHKHRQAKTPPSPKGKVVLFFDEFTNFQDVNVGIAALKLLWYLGYQVLHIPHVGSGRAQLSKGFLKTARKRADANVKAFSRAISADVPLIGVEPSAILSFRDEYPKLVSEKLRDKATALQPHCLLIDEFLAQELKAKRLTAKDFPQVQGHVQLHGHCHQKAISTLRYTKEILQAAGLTTTLIPSGCCGMAGSFGY